MRFRFHVALLAQCAYYNLWRHHMELGELSEPVDTQNCLVITFGEVQNEVSYLRYICIVLVAVLLKLHKYTPLIVTWHLWWHTKLAPGWAFIPVKFDPIHAGTWVKSRGWLLFYTTTALVVHRHLAVIVTLASSPGESLGTIALRLVSPAVLPSTFCPGNLMSAGLSNAYIDS